MAQDKPAQAAITARDSRGRLSREYQHRARKRSSSVGTWRLFKLWQRIKFIFHINQFRIRVFKVSRSQPHYASD